MRLKVEYIPVDDIQPYAGNAKIHTAEQIEQIKKSITEFGFNDPIATWHGEIVEGHGRYLAAKELNIDKVPVISLDSLTDEQRKAYTLIHNQLTLNTKFDADLLSVEIEGIEDIDLGDFGIDLPDLPDFDDSGYYGDERERTNNAYNLDIAHDTEMTTDFWQMPVIKDDGYTPEKLIGFNYAKSSKDKACGIHFFVDDYQFERVWTAPEKYFNVLLEYECILSPDFSLYMDMPMPMKIWNIYRSRQIGAYYQSKGIKVIPTISWAEQETYSFCFEGIPEGSIVAVSTVGVKENKDALAIWRDGMDAMIERIKPRMILCYGGKIDYDYKGIEVRFYENQVLEDWRGRKNDKG